MTSVPSWFPFVVSVGLLGVASPPPDAALWQQVDRSVLAMGTRLGLHLEGTNPEVLWRASERALREVDRIEEACSTWRPESRWSELNAAKARPVPLEAEWRALLQTALAWNRRTEGAFDPVLGALVRAYGLREGGRTPSPDLLAEARAASGAALLQLDAARGTARLSSPFAAVEEGAFVKGYALDRARERLERAGVRSGWLDFGGQLLAWGAPREVGIAGPTDRHQTRLRILLTNASLSTSSSSERGRHHIDPRTGNLSPAWGSVSVVAANGLTADILSTALYVLGPERGLAWADQNGVAAVFFVQANEVRQSRAFRSLPLAASPL
jgi:thiamine biosynthesis lipoprotein